MPNAAAYFEFGRNEERAGNQITALLFYLSSFCDCFNSGNARPYGVVAKIRRLQLSLGLSDMQLFDAIHSYGPLSDSECRKLLAYSIYGSVAGINAVLSHTE